MVDTGTLATIASIIAAFGAAMLFFRLQRELDMGNRGEIVWLPLADWLLVVATVVCLLLVILPITFSSNSNLPAAGSAAAAVIVAGYVFAIMAHYRIVFDRPLIMFGEKRAGPRTNPEPSELCFVIITLIAASSAFALRLIY